MSPKKASPKASSWEKLSQQKVSETHANRDVYESQQLDRSQIEKVQTRTSRTVGSAAAAVAVALLVWVGASLLHFGLDTFRDVVGADGVHRPDFYSSVSQVYSLCYQATDADGELIDGAPCYDTVQEMRENPPQWYIDYVQAQEAAAAEARAERGESAQEYVLQYQRWKLVVSVLGGLALFGILHPILMRNLDTQNLMRDTVDINQHAGDQHIAVPEEVQRKFSWFPNVGAHSSVQANSLISHVMITNKGLKKVEIAHRADQDILDEDGDVEYYKGEILRTVDGDPKVHKVPLIDEAFGDKLWDDSGLPREKYLRRKFDTTAIDYNPGGKTRVKYGAFDKVSDLINEDWTLPLFEPQRPSGAYLVDEAPVNTMVLAMTRAGKGQTYIEPLIDMWLRERRPNNMVINDPKGELLVKNYVKATMRGFEVIQLNLINGMKTDIWNPLGMAAEAAREGDYRKCAEFVENLAGVFFPLDGAEDPVWPNAANNAFKRAAYGLIDYYLEEERQFRSYAQRVNMDPKLLETELDERWGRVTLYNCYQLFVQLSSKKIKNPLKKLDERMKDGDFGGEEDFDADAYEDALSEAEAQEPIWDGAPELDMLTLYFNATKLLPQSDMRREVNNADNALRSMAAAEKMLASVYGIAITAMSFFTDPTISTLTSGRPSQNVDLGGLSFPRRIGVRFNANYLRKYTLIGAQAVWDAWEDSSFTKKLDGEFDHEDLVSKEGWARYFFKGKFPHETTYLRLRLKNAQTGMLRRTYYFKFTKDYQTSLHGRRYIKDPITKSKIVKNGLLVELLPHDENGKLLPGDTDPKNVAAYELGHTKFDQMRLVNLTLAQPEKEATKANAIISNSVRYSERPKTLFLVTPPHLMKYSKLILILIKQLVDMSFDKSYMTKPDQKPLYKTRFMLDELGNLQSEGSGISGFETMLSIGLGQDQQFTLILQTLQQLKDVYGDSVDKIVQGNASNIVFLKSTDDSMIQTLETMSGKTHTVYRDSKTVTKDVGKVLKFGSVEGKVSYTSTAKEEPVIKYNDLNYLSERNSIVFRAGDSPVWNRNETILPMSFSLFANTINHPGHKYSLQTIPTLSTAMEFDVRQNQPDFEEMLAKRMRQAVLVDVCRETYKVAHGYSDAETKNMDQDVLSADVMELVDVAMRENIADGHEDYDDADEVPMEALQYDLMMFEAEHNSEQEEVLNAEQSAQQERQLKRYARGMLAREDLVTAARAVTHQLDEELVECFKAIRSELARDRSHFRVDGSGNLRSADGQQVYIRRAEDSEGALQMRNAAEDTESRVFAEPGSVDRLETLSVTDEFYLFLAGLESWLDLADGEFDKEMVKQLVMKENVSLS